MANKAKKDNKNAIIGCICAAVVVIVVVIVAVVLATNGNKLNDSYFKSDDTKYVLTMESDGTDTDEYTPIKTHLVYTYSGDEITGMTSYYEYADEAKAKAAADVWKENAGDSYKEIYANGKYVVLVSNESDYEGVTASDVKQQIEFMEMLKNMNFDDSEETVVEGEEVTTEDGDTVEAVEVETVEE